MNKNLFFKKVAYGTCNCRSSPVVSVVMPVFNQENLVDNNLNSLLNSMTVPFDMVVVDDHSEDKTLKKIVQYFKSIENKFDKLCRYSIYTARFSQFETECDTFAFSMCRTNIVIEVQADMVVNDNGFDSRLIQALNSNPDIFLISGRGTLPFEEAYKLYISTLGSDIAQGRSILKYAVHRILAIIYKKTIYYLFSSLPFKSDENYVEFKHDECISSDEVFPNLDAFQKSSRAGRLGPLIEHNYFTANRYIWVGEAVIRGPLIIDLSKYNELCGFDKKSFFLGYDDICLCIKAWVLKSYRCGFHPINFSSPISSGSTRKKRSICQELLILLQLIRIKKSNKNNYLKNYLNYRNSCKNPTKEIRRF